MKRINDLFPELLRKQPQRQLPVEEIVRESWGHLVGPFIAARSQVFRLFNQTLTVHVPDRAWKKQLHRMEWRLLQRINHLLGQEAVKALDLRVDESMLVVAASSGGSTELTPAMAPGIAPRKGPARQEPAAGQPAGGAEEAELQESARAIADPELRELFLRTSRKMVRFRRTDAAR